MRFAKSLAIRIDAPTCTDKSVFKKVGSSRAATVRERFSSANSDRFLTGAALKKALLGRVACPV